MKDGKGRTQWPNENMTINNYRQNDTQKNNCRQNATQKNNCRQNDTQKNNCRQYATQKKQNFEQHESLLNH